MEGTSGAADPGFLRGDPGEAALGPGGVGLREQSGALVRADARGLRKQLRWVCSGRRPRESGPCRGHAGPRSRVCSRGRPVRRDRRRCVARLRPDGAWRRLLLPVLPCSRDTRCPSESGRGEAPSSAFERTARDVGRREPAGPWLVKPRLARGKATVRRPQGLQRCSCHDVTRSRRSTGRTGPQPRQEGFLPVQRKLDASRRAFAPGIERSHGCARGLFWLQKSTGGVRSRCSIRSEPQARPRIRLGLAIQPCAWVVKGRRKPASRWKHRGAGARLPVIPCLSA